MSKIDDYTKFAENVARDDSHGYDQSDRWGNPDYDCSGLVISAVQSVGIKVKDAGASYTGNLRNAFLKCGFVDITNKVNRSTGAGLVRGDILLSEGHHVAIYCGSGKMVDARINENGGILGGKSGDQTGQEIMIHSYSNHPWTHILRYKAKTSTKDTVSTSYKATESPRIKNEALSGSYYATENLNMRNGAGATKQLMVTLPKGTKVQNYGYYTSVAGTKWLYVETTLNGAKYTGFCSSKYLSK